MKVSELRAALDKMPADERVWIAIIDDDGKTGVASITDVGRMRAPNDPNRKGPVLLSGENGKVE